MQSRRELYGPRDRALNRELIGALMRSENSAREAVAAIIADFHPSVLSELLALGREMRDDQPEREIIRAISAELYFMTLPANLSLRWHESGRAPWADLLDQEAAFFKDYWAFDSKDRRLRASSFIGKAARLWLNATGRGSLSTGRAVDLRALDARAVQASNWTALSRGISEVLSNCLFRALDDPLARPRAEVFLQEYEVARHASWPVALAESGEDGFAHLSVWLAETSEVAQRYVLNDWLALARRSSELASGFVPWAPVFGMEAVFGMATCGRCAMRYANQTVVVLSPASVKKETTAPEMIFIPAEFNVSTCPFCGWAAQTVTPGLMYSDVRHQIIYCVPRYGNMTVEDAIEHSRPRIAQFREMCRNMLEPSMVERFDSATELITHDPDDFVTAIHLGEVVPEDHAYSVIECPDGSAILVDTTKAVIRQVSRREWEHNRDRLRPLETDESKAVSFESPEAAIEYYAERVGRRPDEVAAGARVLKMLYELGEAGTERVLRLLSS